MCNAPHTRNSLLSSKVRHYDFRYRNLLTTFFSEPFPNDFRAAARSSFLTTLARVALPLFHLSHLAHFSVVNIFSFSFISFTQNEKHHFLNRAMRRLLQEQCAGRLFLYRACGSLHKVSKETLSACNSTLRDQYFLSRSPGPAGFTYTTRRVVKSFLRGLYGASRN